MKNVYLVLVVSTLVSIGSVVFAQEDGEAVMLQYGTIESVKTVHDDGKRAGGAVVGGLAGAAIADDHRGLGMLAGGLIGSSVQKHNTEETLAQYTIKLVTSATLVVNSDQMDMIVGDCVVVEKGEYTNVRRVRSKTSRPHARCSMRFATWYPNVSSPPIA